MDFIYPSSTSRPKGHYSPAAVHNGFVFVSGQISTDDKGQPILDSIEEQTKRCLEKIRVILDASNSSLNRILKVSIFISNMDDWGKVNTVYSEFFGDHRPARIIVPSGPLHYGCAVEIDCIAAVN
ncbi:MAG: RidA family protein [Cyclobacteriaceae bacterium]|nr:RidA family protein [Cyclobacteriaceae bacterium]